MWTVIIGGGKGCQAILELAQGAFLRELTLDVLCVMDLDADAPGMAYARKHGLKTTTRMDEVLSIPDIELIIELTGRDAVVEEIRSRVPSEVKIIDHTMAHLFWDLVDARETQRRQLEETTELERKIESERQYIQSLFDSIPDVVVVLDRDRKVVRTNARFTELTGIPDAEALGRTCHKLFEGTEAVEDCPAACPFQEVLDTGRPNSIVHRTPPPKETYWVITQTPILNKEGHTKEIIETWHRITQMVMLRREIEQSEQRFRQFIDSAKDLISIKDLEGRYLVINKPTADAFGLNESEVMDKKAEDVLPLATAKMINIHDQEVIRVDAARNYEEVFQIDGRDRHFLTTRFPLHDYKGDIVGVCTITRDVTERKQLQEQLVQSAKLVAVGQLAAGVAHEINNPLTGILAYAEDILDEFEEGEPLHADMKVIIRETLRCREIVRNLLDFGRQDAPKLENVNLNDVMDKALVLVERLPRFKDIAVKKEKADSLPMVRADPRQLQQVVLNFMLNAVDAMDEKGDVILTTEYDRRHDKCVISVEDTGPGIPENLIDKVFEPFFSSKGTSGLGLALSWGIVERHRGVIEVDIAESGGAIFRVILPRLEETEAT